MDPVSESDGGRPQGLTLVRGGEDLDVTYIDGRTERVFVRLMPLKSMGAYLAAIGDESRSIELFCDKPEGWSDELTTESQLAILEKGQGLNLPLFEKWYPQWMRRMTVLKPDLLKSIGAAVQSAMSRNGSSPSSASAPSSVSEPASP